MSRVLTCFLVIGFLAAAAPATVSFAWEEAAGTPPTGYVSYDLKMTVDSNIAQIQMYIDSYAPAAGDFYQNSGHEFDTQVMLPVTGDIGGAAINILGGARAYTFDDQLLDVMWGVAGGAYSGAGTFQVARVTLKDDLLYGAWEIWGQEITLVDPSPQYTASDTLPGWPLYSAWPGDANLDRTTAIGDFIILQSNWNTPSGMDWGDGDFNDDDGVAIGDFIILQSKWNTSPSEPPEPLMTPEPTTVVLLTISALLMAGRARRK